MVYSESDVCLAQKPLVANDAWRVSYVECLRWLAATSAVIGLAQTDAIIFALGFPLWQLRKILKQQRIFI